MCAALIANKKRSKTRQRPSTLSRRICEFTRISNSLLKVRAIMSTTPPYSPLSPTRRTVLAASAVAGAASVLPASVTAAADSGAVRPFHFKASDNDLADLRRRIEATKWPEQETVADDSQGVRLKTMQQLVHYWGRPNTTGANARPGSMP